MTLTSKNNARKTYLEAYSYKLREILLNTRKCISLYTNLSLIAFEGDIHIIHESITRLYQVHSMKSGNSLDFVKLIESNVFQFSSIIASFSFCLWYLGCCMLVFISANNMHVD